MGIAQVDSDEVGRAILEPLRDLDEIAYLRFASVYSSFETLDDFERAIHLLRELKNEGQPVPGSLGQAGEVPGDSAPSTRSAAQPRTVSPTSRSARVRREATGTLPLPSEITTPVKKSRRKGKKEVQPPEQGTLIG